MKKLVKKFVVVLMVLCLASSVMAVPVTDNLVLQLDMSDVTTTNVGGVDYVTSWNDLTSNENDAVAVASNNQPILVSNITPAGKSAIKFDGTDDYLNIAPDSTFDGGNWTMFAVYAVDVLESGSGTQRIINLGYSDVNPGTATQVNSSTYSMAVGGTKGVRGFSRTITGSGIIANSLLPTDYAADTFYVGTMTNNSATASVTSYINSAGEVKTATTSGATAVGSGNNVAYIGAGTASLLATTPLAGYMNGWVSEILIYNRVLSGTEITSVNEYLNAKYIPEPATISLLAMGIMGLFVRRGK